MKNSSGYRKDLGKWGEDFASQWLQDKGYTLLCANYHCRQGEVDLIMQSPEILVAVEVKTRKSSQYGYGEESITRKKLTALQESMEKFLMENPHLPNSWQLDVVVIEPRAGELPNIFHYENVGLDD